MGRKVITVVGVCAAAAALPMSLAESAVASSGSSSSSVVSVSACPGGVEVGVDTGIVGIGVTVGESCQTAPATPIASPTETSSGGTGLPPPSIGPTGPQPTEPEPTAVDICTLPPPPTTPASVPKAVVLKAAPVPSPAVAAPVIIPTPTATPTSTKAKPTPTPKPPAKVAPTPVIVQIPAAYHAVPFHRISPVLIVFVVAIVPVSLARIRRRSR